MEQVFLLANFYFLYFLFLQREKDFRSIVLLRQRLVVEIVSGDRSIPQVVLFDGLFALEHKTGEHVSLVLLIYLSALFFQGC